MNQTASSIINSKDLDQNIFNNKLPNLPLDVSTELNEYSKLFICKRYNPFRKFCCYEFPLDYEIFGELPSGDKRLLFTCQEHFEYCWYCRCCCCCCGRNVNCYLDCLLCGYLCKDFIEFQMDYRRNDKNFYTQGVNLKAGCYCCKCLCCKCKRNKLYLRENIDPDNPDFNCGIPKGKTVGNPICCCNCDKEATYYNQDGTKGPKVQMKIKCCLCNCCDCSGCCCCCCCCDCLNTDLYLSIVDDKDQVVGNIMVPYGMCSEKAEKQCFYCAGKNYEINLPPNSTSIEKFQIVADVIHFDLENGIL